jgi:hypothetical protein
VAAATVTIGLRPNTPGKRHRASRRADQLLHPERQAFPEPIVDLTWNYEDPGDPTPEELARELNGSALENVPDPNDATKMILQKGKQRSGAMYELGFKDVYPWVWSVMLGVAITLAERRGAFQVEGTKSTGAFWMKNAAGVLFNLALPSVLFGLTLVRLGPKYSVNMDFWQILGSLYLAGAPLGSHHVWLMVARSCGWISAQESEREGIQHPHSSFVWILIAFLIPAFAPIAGWRVPF